MGAGVGVAVAVDRLDEHLHQHLRKQASLAESPAPSIDGDPSSGRRLLAPPSLSQAAATPAQRPTALPAAAPAHIPPPAAFTSARPTLRTVANQRLSAAPPAPRRTAATSRQP